MNSENEILSSGQVQADQVIVGEGEAAAPAKLLPKKQIIGEGEAGTHAKPLPKELEFLTRPDYYDKEFYAAHCHGGAFSDDDDDESDDDRSKSDRTRVACGVFLHSKLLQTLILAVVCFDCTLGAISFTQIEVRDEVFAISNYVSLIVLGVDVLGRIFVHRLEFFRNKLNIIEFCLLPLMIVELYVWENSPISLLRGLRPAFKAGRFLRLLALRYRGERHLREKFSEGRIRYDQHGFFLDLVYVTPGIIAMSSPVTGNDAIFMNPLKEVERFLNSQHRCRYLVVNATDQQSYPLEGFHHRHLQFPIPQNGVPDLEGLHQFCQTITGFLEAGSGHVVAVHSTHGQGRVCLLTAALLLHQRMFDSVEEAVMYVDRKRSHPKISKVVAHERSRALACASQYRFLVYFHDRYCAKTALKSAPNLNSPLLKEKKGPATPQAVRLKSILIKGMKESGTVHVRCFKRPPTRLLHHSPRDKVVLVSRDEVQCDGAEKNVGCGVPYGESDVGVHTKQLIGTQRLMEVLEECKLESILAGCQPEQDGHVFDTQQQNSEITQTSSSSNEWEVSWELNDMLLTDEIIFEVYRCKPQKTSSPSGKASLHRSTSLRRSTSTSSKKSIGKSKSKGLQNSFLHGLSAAPIFCARLHASFLELEDAGLHVIRQSTGNQKVVTVAFKQFDLDKAAMAPSLASHSPALGLQFDFLVEHGEYESKEGDKPEKEKFDAGLGEWSEPETLKWLTWSVKRIWPYADEAVAKLLRELVEPLINDALPDALKGVQISRFSLGESAPILGPIVASARDFDGYHVQLDIAIHWEADVDIMIDTKAAKIGIRKVTLDGTISVRLKPILTEIPIVAGVRIFFINQPVIDLEFAGNLEFANFNFIRKAIFGAVDQLLLGLLVLPNLLSIQYSMDILNSGKEIVTFKNALPLAVLRIWIVQALNLHGADVGLFTQESHTRTSDPYTLVQMGSQQHQTSTKQKTTNPEWNEELDFFLYEMTQEVNILVYDQDLTSLDDSLGAIHRLPVSKLLDKPDGLWLTLNDVPGGQLSSILIRAELMKFSTDNRIIEELLPAEEMPQVASTKSAPANKANATMAIQCKSTAKATVNFVADKASSAASKFLRSEDEKEDLEKKKKQKAVAVIRCQLIAGHIPPEVVAHGSLELRIGSGHSMASQPITEKTLVDVTCMTAATQDMVEKLALKGWDAPEIADAVSEDVGLVQRVVDSRLGWNVESHNRLNVVLRNNDLQLSHVAQIELVSKGTCIARGECPLRSIIAGGEDGLEETFELSSKKGPSVAKKSRDSASTSDIKNRFQGKSCTKITLNLAFFALVTETAHEQNALLNDVEGMRSVSLKKAKEKGFPSSHTPHTAEEAIGA